MIESLCLMSMGKYSKYILQCMWQEYGGGGFTFSKKKISVFKLVELCQHLNYL